ncbi:MAG: murein L,D-transpeptidase family protein [Candidatus Binatia bacterium]
MMSRTHGYGVRCLGVGAALAIAALSGCLTSQGPAPQLVGAVALAPAAQVDTEPERWILVRKTQRTLSLYEGKRVLKTYPVVLGRDPVWAKLYEGDHRTPEGEYHIVKKYFHPFWERFMLLDYPTPFNETIYGWSRRNGLLPVRGSGVPDIGGAIGIHGTADDGLNRRGINWTEGCISLLSHDVDELYDLVPVGTRVVIGR